MNVKGLIKLLQAYSNPDAKIRLIQGEELECMPEWWDEVENMPGGKASELYSEDVHSHQWYLLAIED